MSTAPTVVRLHPVDDAHRDVLELVGLHALGTPDNVSMAAVALAIDAGGGLSPLETTVLMSVEETMEAMGRAQQVRYRPPGS